MLDLRPRLSAALVRGSILLLLLCATTTAWAQGPGVGPERPRAPVGDGASSPHDAPDPHRGGELAERGRALLDGLGCVGCHSLDGSAGVGPTFADVYGGLASVVVDGKQRGVAYDRAYLIRSMAAPDAEIAAGYRAGVMPSYTVAPDDVLAIEAALVAQAQAAPEPRPAGWGPLIAGALLFVLGHLLLSSAPLRRPLTRVIGEAPFQIVYSLVALGGMILLVQGYDFAPYVELWPPLRWTKHITLTLMPIAMIFLVVGYTTPNPTSAGQAKRVDDPGAVTGILTVTRHPALWGFALWAIAHIPPNGDLASVVFFGAFAALSVLGMVHIDRRRARSLGEPWQGFVRQTSLIPFGAVLTGRTRLSFGFADLLRVVAALGAFGALLLMHQWLFGVDPLP